MDGGGGLLVAPAARAKLLWAGAIAFIAAGALAAAEVHGRGARTSFAPPPELRGRTVAAVRDAADALRIWDGAGLRGRQLVLLTGQWSKPSGGDRHGPGRPDALAAATAATRGEGTAEPLDARNALFTAARLGVLRSLDVVMPAAAFTHRLGEVAGEKELVRGEGGFRLPYRGLERRFSTARAFVAPEEQVLVLVEPTWFSDPGSDDPLAWLAAAGVRSDLALVALDDPGASDRERATAQSYAAAVGAPFLETGE